MKAIWLGGLGGALIICLIGLGIYFAKQNAPVAAPVSSESEIRSETPMAEGKVYVAVENEGVIVVLSEKENTLLARISLEKKDGLKLQRYTAHNVQVSPDGRSVWVTANTMGSSSGHGVQKSAANVDDEVIVIDPRTDAIAKRISMGNDNHLSHVVLSPDGKFAYVASQEKNIITEINTQTYAITRTYSLRADSGPHGMRLSPDGRLAILALLEGKGMGILDLQSGMTEYISLPGAAVQTAVTPDGKYALASVYDPTGIAVYDFASKEIRFVPLPSEAKGPVQIYSSTDSQKVYIADQGVYFEKEAGSTVYELSLQGMKVTRSIPVGKAPHGVVVSADNSRLYVTNLESDDVSVVDLQNGTEIARIPVGDAPNGISVWTVSSLGKNP
jgi:YVTN family beta-propeller protein